MIFFEWMTAEKFDNGGFLGFGGGLMVKRGTHFTELLVKQRGWFERGVSNVASLLDQN